MRIYRRYKPSCDLRTDRMTRGKCGRPYCYRPARWIWIDAAGKQRHVCDEHRRKDAPASAHAPGAHRAS